MFQYVDLRALRGGARTLLARLPTLPAVYAWRRGLHLPPNAAPEIYLADLLAYVEAASAPRVSRRISPLHSVTLDSGSRLSDAKLERLELLVEDPAFRMALTHTLQAAQPLQAPLYVGKAVNLQQRIAQHLAPMSELSVRLRAAGVALESCVLAYRTLDNETTLFGTDALPLIEEILTYVSRPGFVLRPG